MPSIASVSKEVISHLARREICEQTSTLKKTSTQYHKDIAEQIPTSVTSANDEPL